MASYATAVLHPLTKTTFFNESWERKHCHIKRGDSTHFKHLISTESISHFLSNHSVSHPQVQLVHSTENLLPSDYTDSQRNINPVVLDEHFSHGATVVLSQAQQHFDSLATLSRDVAKQFQMRAQTNVYLSPPGNQGFRSHYDTHDVFILQVSGRKTFRFYPSDVALPFPDDEYDPEQNPHTDITEEILLEAGDTLYIPRGLVHDAVAMPDASSLHITLGVFPVIVRDLLQTCIQVAAEQNVTLRETISSSLFENDSVPALGIEAIKEEITRNLTQEHLNEAYSRALDDMAIESVPLTQALFERQSLSPDSIVSIINDAIFGYERQGGSFKLRTHGQIMSFNEPLSSAVENLFRTDQTTVKEIAGLDPEQQIALCVHLRSSHLLHIQNT